MKCRAIFNCISNIFKKEKADTTTIQTNIPTSPDIIKKDISEKIINQPVKLIAPFIPNINSFISHNSTNPGFGISNHLIFKQLNPLPEDYKYKIDSIDNIYGKYQGDVKYDIIQVANGIAVNLIAEPINSASSGEVLLRVNMKLKSSNYEDIKFTVFLTA